MRNNQVKITIKRQRGVIKPVYNIMKVTGAITVDTRKRANLTVGDVLSDQEATELLPHYQVTVIG
jgi:hypothetical protein